MDLARCSFMVVMAIIMSCPLIALAERDDIEDITSSGTRSLALVEAHQVDSDTTSGGPQAPSKLFKTLLKLTIQRNGLAHTLFKGVLGKGKEKGRSSKTASEYDTSYACHDGLTRQQCTRVEDYVRTFNREVKQRREERITWNWEHHRKCKDPRIDYLFWYMHPCWYSFYQATGGAADDGEVLTTDELAERLDQGQYQTIGENTLEGTEWRSLLVAPGVRTNNVLQATEDCEDNFDPVFKEKARPAYSNVIYRSPMVKQEGLESELPFNTGPANVPYTQGYCEGIDAKKCDHYKVPVAMGSRKIGTTGRMEAGEVWVRCKKGKEEPCEADFGEQGFCIVDSSFYNMGAPDRSTWFRFDGEAVPVIDKFPDDPDKPIEEWWLYIDFLFPTKYDDDQVRPFFTKADKVCELGWRRPVEKCSEKPASKCEHFYQIVGQGIIFDDDDNTDDLQREFRIPCAGMEGKKTCDLGALDETCHARATYDITEGCAHSEDDC